MRRCRPSFDQAYDRCYRHGLDAATLEGYGQMLEKLVRGQWLSPMGTQRLFTATKFGTPGEYRLEAGLPKTGKFTHKTGTQYRRACHVGVVNPQNGGAKAVVIATCAADLDDQKEAGGVFEDVGRAVPQTVLAGGRWRRAAPTPPHRHAQRRPVPRPRACRRCPGPVAASKAGAKPDSRSFGPRVATMRKKSGLK